MCNGYAERQIQFNSSHLMRDMKLQLWQERKMLTWDTQVQYELSHVCSYIPLYYLSALQFSSIIPLDSINKDNSNDVVPLVA